MKIDYAKMMNIKTKFDCFSSLHYSACGRKTLHAPPPQKNSVLCVRSNKFNLVNFFL